ncbi:stage IV sporulation protein A [Candidatus Epulonipiscium viviparus]|uniref:stage IV sporulation protein A n=1 Tax=Candidatus Epulonipiscium viviparus TaxID=420336 RepID=UPI00016C08B1|nr:stage IV sporulation protein A [Candidatus Epulopiscium viviparus]
MENYDIYRDIQERTAGDIYLGIVGPVRTGKSTFIKRFMEALVIPNIQNEYSKERAQDELPQSGGGTMITTTEPKFIPNEAVNITIGGDFSVNVRLIDCVGYVIPDAEGYLYTDNTPRMVQTPWYNEDIPFTQAAEIGTKKVINDHSTIGIVVTTDGSITDIPRSSYLDAEDRVITELKSLGKPFIVIFNTKKPFDQEVLAQSSQLSQQYDVPVVPLDVAQMKIDDINQILERVLYEFPLNEIQFTLPKWAETLENDHWFKQEWIAQIKEHIYPLENIRQVKDTINKLTNIPNVKNVYLEKIQLGDGVIKVVVHTSDDLFYKVLSETTGLDIHGDHELMSLIKNLAQTQKEYDKVALALEDVRRKGYGVVSPSKDEFILETPETISQGTSHGVKLCATAPSYHIIRADIQTEVSPIIGTEEQVQQVIDELTHTTPEYMWETNIMFGRTLYDIVNEGLQNKLYKIPEDAQQKLQETLQKIINEGTGGLLCIIL